MAICGICNSQESKYKCPKCEVLYCLLKCFKTEIHKAKDAAVVVGEKPEGSSSAPKLCDEPAATIDELSPFGSIVADQGIQSMLRAKGLQLHLLTLVKMLEDALLTGENESSARKELALRKLAALRSGGSEENQIVEEFAARVEQLMAERDD